MNKLEKIRLETPDHNINAAMYFCGPESNRGGEDFIDYHHDTIVDFAIANNVTITKKYIVSQKYQNMSTFLKMLKDYDSKEFDILLTYSVEDLALEYNEWPFFRAQIQRHAIPLVSILEPFEEDDPDIVCNLNMLHGYQDFLHRMDSIRWAEEDVDSNKCDKSASHHNGTFKEYNGKKSG